MLEAFDDIADGGILCKRAIWSRQEDLLTDLYDIPSRSCDRKGELNSWLAAYAIYASKTAHLWLCGGLRHMFWCHAVNEFVKRVRAARIHCLIIGLQMPSTEQPGCQEITQIKQEL
jgi:hypothetical protein